jgi:sugar phosphate isomerase/epimerase
VSGRILAVVGLLATGSAATAGELAVGYCTLDLAAAKAAGFDYAEVPLRRVAALSETEFSALVREQRKLGLPTPVANVFLPVELPVVGPSVDGPRLSAYVEHAFSRARALGVEVVVFGSGGARRVPEGFAREEALRQLTAFGRRAAEAAARHGLVIAVEPLRRAETNLVNTTAEGLAWVKAVDHPAFRLMVDLFHVAEENDSLVSIVEAAGQMVHAHVANPRGRAFPLDASEYDYAGYLRALRRAGHGGRISVETSSGSLDADGARSVAFLRKAYAAAAAVEP